MKYVLFDILKTCHTSEREIEAPDDESAIRKAELIWESLSPQEQKCRAAFFLQRIIDQNSEEKPLISTNDRVWTKKTW